MLPGKNTSHMLPIFGAKSVAKSARSTNVLLIDWSNVLHRAAAVSAPGAVMATLAKMLLSYRRRFPAWFFVFALEGSRGTDSRKAILPSYKDNRGEKSDDFSYVEELSMKLLGSLYCATICATEGEADDAIATYATNRSGARTIIVSEDKDLWQLISTSVTVWGKQGTEITQERCFGYLGVPPMRVPMLKALLGDRSDNIQRAIPRVKTASLTKLALEMHEPSGLEEALAKVQDLTEKDLAKIRDNWSAVIQNYKVVTLQKGLPLVEKQYRADPEELERLLHSHGAFGPTREDVELIASGSTL